MTKRACTGLADPLAFFENAARITQLAGLVLGDGDGQRYVLRTALRARQGGLVLISMAARDIDYQGDQKRLVRALRSAVAYLERCERSDHALPGFKAACRDARRNYEELIGVIDGGWSERMVPMVNHNDNGEGVKLGDFREWEGNHIYLDCQGVNCNHRKKMLVTDLVGKYGPETTLDALRRRMRCGECGSRRTGFTIPWAAYSGGPAPC